MARNIAAVAVVPLRRTVASCPVPVRKRRLHHHTKRIMSAVKVAAAPYRCRAPNNKHIVHRATTTRIIATVRLLAAMAKIAPMNAANATIIVSSAASIKSVIIVIAPHRHHRMPTMQCLKLKHPQLPTQQHLRRHRRLSARSVS